MATSQKISFHQQEQILSLKVGFYLQQWRFPLVEKNFEVK